MVWEFRRRAAGTMLAAGLALSAGCLFRSHTQVDIVDANGVHHQGYYDDTNLWRGGYYDQQHEWHDDPRNWHR